MNLSDTQVNDLAKSLVSIMIQFYENPKNEEDFKKKFKTFNQKDKKERKNEI